MHCVGAWLGTDCRPCAKEAAALVSGRGSSQAAQTHLECGHRTWTVGLTHEKASRSMNEKDLRHQPLFLNQPLSLCLRS